jgi:hypothetical protein
MYTLKPTSLIMMRKPTFNPVSRSDLIRLFAALIVVTSNSSMALAQQTPTGFDAVKYAECGKLLK